MSKNFQLMIHGGAGLVVNKEDYTESIQRILQAGVQLLSQGVAALDVVETCVRLLEDDPLFNAGCGSVLNSHGAIEMDAAIMNGEDLQAGSVAGVREVRNPISLARLVMEKSPHVMLIGEGALEFAHACQVPCEPESYFVTERRLKQWQQAQSSDRQVLDHSTGTDDKKFGTVGAVARDCDGHLAAATSTGGITNKRFGRVGDSPIIGAGVFADDVSCAVSTTGYGEGFIRTTFAKRVAEYIEHNGMTAQKAAEAAIQYLSRRVNGEGGVIVIDKDGNCGASFCTAAMIHGRADESGVLVLT